VEGQSFIELPLRHQQIHVFGLYFILRNVEVFLLNRLVVGHVVINGAVSGLRDEDLAFWVPFLFASAVY
jgi:hypothetical protein